MYVVYFQVNIGVCGVAVDGAKLQVAIEVASVEATERQTVAKTSLCIHHQQQQQMLIVNDALCCCV